MRDRTIRAFLASVVLAGLTVAGVIQVWADRDTSTAEITASGSPTTVLETAATFDATTSTTAEPFVYRVGVLSGITTDNFWAFYGQQPSAWNSYVLGPTKPALFTSNTTQGTLAPELAASEVDAVREDGVWQVVVPLDPDLDWSDGTPVTGDDLVFTFNTVRRLDLGGSWADAFPPTVEAIEAVADHRVRIEFSSRPRLSEWPHGVGLAPIMAKHVWRSKVKGVTAQELYAMSGNGDVGGGPLVLAEVSDELMISRRNPGYPAEDLPEVIEYHVYQNEAEAVSALGRGEIDSVLSPKGLAANDLAAIEPEPGVAVINSPGNGIRYLGFNLERAPMSSQAFRTALALLVDREALAGSISQVGAAAWSILPAANSLWFDPKIAAKETRIYDGPMAERLATALDGLTGAGYVWEKPPSIDAAGELVPGKGLTINGVTPQQLTILTPGDAYDPARPEYAKEIAKTLDALGFEANPVETDFDTVVDLAFTPSDDGAYQYDMYLLGWTLGDPALPGYYRALFAADGAMNNTGYDSKAFARALSRYEDAFTTEEALEALWQMEHTLAVQLPYLVLYNNEITEVYRADRVAFDTRGSLGGLQATLGGIWDVRPAD